MAEGSAIPVQRHRPQPGPRHYWFERLRPTQSEVMQPRRVRLTSALLGEPKGSRSTPRSLFLRHDNPADDLLLLEASPAMGVVSCLPPHLARTQLPTLHPVRLPTQPRPRPTPRSRSGPPASPPTQPPTEPRSSVRSPAAPAARSPARPLAYSPRLPAPRGFNRVDGEIPLVYGQSNLFQLTAWCGVVEWTASTAGTK